MSCEALEKAISTDPIAVKMSVLLGSVKDIKIKLKIIINCEINNQLFLWPKFWIGILKLSITNVMGKKVKSIPSTKQKNLQVDISDLSDGHYNIKIETKGFVVFKSFLISK